MKIIRTLALTFAFALLGAGAAVADNQPHQTQLFLQRQAIERNQTTIALYTYHRTPSQRHVEKRSESRFELRTNAKGQQFGVYVPVK